MPNESAYGHVRNLIEGLTPLWLERMGLSHWEIDHKYHDTLYVDEPVVDSYLVTATTEGRWNYLQAKINWYLPSAVRHDDERLEVTLVHELCHVVLMPEQSLLEHRVDQVKESTEDPADRTVAEKLIYERMELATEQMTKVVWRAWQR